MKLYRTISKKQRTEKAIQDSTYHTSPLSREEAKRIIEKTRKNGEYLRLQKSRSTGYYRIAYKGVSCIEIEDNETEPCGREGSAYIDWSEEDVLVLESENVYDDPIDTVENYLVAYNFVVVARLRNENQFKRFSKTL